MYVYMIGRRGTGCVWRLEDNFVESVVSFNIYMGSEIELRLPDLCSKCLYLLSHLAGPLRSFQVGFGFGKSKGYLRRWNCS